MLSTLCLSGNESYQWQYFYETKKYKLIAKDDTGKIYNCKLTRLEYLDKFSFKDEPIIEGLSFEFEIPINKIKEALNT